MEQPVFPLDGHVQACPQVRLRDIAPFDDDGNLLDVSIFPRWWMRRFEENQKLPRCCRHPENHWIEAKYSSDLWRWQEKLNNGVIEHEPFGGVPNVYQFTCSECGNLHHMFCVGRTDDRPFWGFGMIAHLILRGTLRKVRPPKLKE